MTDLTSDAGEGASRATPPLPHVLGVPEEVYAEPALTDNVVLRALRGHVKRCIDCHMTGSTCADAASMIEFIVPPNRR